MALGLRLHLLEDVSLHDDEAHSQSLYIRQPAHHLLLYYTPNNQWLSNILGYGLGQVGPHRFLLRWPSVLFGVLAVPLIGLTGHQLFKDRRTGLIAAWGLCLSAFHLQWSQQFRGYSSLLFFALLSFFWLDKALQTGSRQYWYGFLIAMLLTLLSHLYGTLMLAVIISLIWSRYLYQVQTKTWQVWRASQQKWALAVSLFALITAGYLLWFGKIYIINSLHPPVQASPLQLLYYQGLAFWPTLSDLSDFLIELAVAFSAQPNQGPALVMFWGLGLAGLALSVRQYLYPAFALGIWFTIPIILVIMADLAIPGFFVFDRYLIFILPAWLLLASHAVVAVTTVNWVRIRSISSTRYKQMIFALFLAAALGYDTFLNLKAAQRYFAERAGNDWRTAAAYLAAHAAPTDLIVCKQLPHRWPPRRLDLGDQCTKELKYRLVDSGLKLRFPIKQLEIVASLNTGLRFRDQANMPGAVWLVLWGETVSPITLLKAGAEATVVANLEQALAQLARLDTTSADRYDYALRRAQILAYQGRLREAQFALDQARKFLADNAQPLVETMAALKTIKVNVAGWSSPAANKLSLDFGKPATLRLTGYNLPASLRPGQTAPVTIFWQTLAPISGDYTIFLHLRNAANQTIAQLDFRPFDGAYPTHQWPANSQIEETRFWIVPHNIAPGAYNLRLGLYEVKGLVHLPAPGDVTGKNGALLREVWVE